MSAPPTGDDHAVHEAKYGSIAAAHVKPERVADALIAYGSHLVAKSGGDPKKMTKIATPERASKFFAKHAKKNKDQALPPDPPPTRDELRKRGIAW